MHSTIPITNTDLWCGKYAEDLAYCRCVADDMTSNNAFDYYPITHKAKTSCARWSVACWIRHSPVFKLGASALGGRK